MRHDGMRTYLVLRQTCIVFNRGSQNANSRSVQGPLTLSKRGHCLFKLTLLTCLFNRDRNTLHMKVEFVELFFSKLIHRYH
jgi:ABC-type enterochelin transport system permease subunit